MKLFITSCRSSDQNDILNRFRLATVNVTHVNCKEDYSIIISVFTVQTGKFKSFEADNVWDHLHTPKWIKFSAYYCILVCTTTTCQMQPHREMSEKMLKPFFFKGGANGGANGCCMRVRVFYFMRLYKLWLLEKQSHVSHTAQHSPIQFQLACALRHMFI